MEGFTRNADFVSYTLKTFFVDQGNVGALETDVFSYSINKNVLASNGAFIMATYGGSFFNTANNKRIAAYFAGNLIFDTNGSPGPTIQTGSTCDWRFVVSLIRDSSSSVRVSALLHWGIHPGSFGNLFTSNLYTTISGLDFTSGNILKMTLTGGATNDLIASMARIVLVK